MNKKINPAVAIATIIIISVIVGGTIYFKNSNGNQEQNSIANSLVIDNSSENNTVSSQEKSQIKTGDSQLSPQDSSLSWMAYENSLFKFEYPSQLGEVIDGGKNAYLVNTFGFSGENEFINKIYIDIFTDQSVNDWQAAIQNSLSNNESIGDSAVLPYPLSVKNLLDEKATDYDCTEDFGEYLDKQKNESCRIVNINGDKAFRIVATGPFQSEVSELKYLFYVNNKWIDFSKNFWVYNTENPEEQLYSHEQLNLIIQGKISDTVIKNDVDIFDKIISTLKIQK